MAKVYATVDCPYCNNPTNVRVRVMDEPDTKTVTCYKHGCEKDFLIRWHAKVTVDIRAGKIDDDMQPMSPDKPPMRHVFHRFSPGDGMFNPLDSLPGAQDEEDAGTMAGLIMDASENLRGGMVLGSIRLTEDLKDIEDIHDRFACSASELLSIERGKAEAIARRLSHERDQEAIRTGKHNFWDELAKEAKRRGVVNPETGEVEFPKKASELRDFVDRVLGKEASEPGAYGPIFDEDASRLYFVDEAWAYLSSVRGGTAEQAADTSNRGWTDKEPGNADKATRRSGNPFAAEWSRKALINDDSES